MLLLDVRCNNKTANIFPLPTLAFNEGSINGTIEVLLDIAGRLELTDDVVKSKVILLKGDLLIIRNARRAIYWRQDELLPLPRFDWLEPVAGLFHLQINVLSVFFDKFWGNASSIVDLDHYNGILKRKYISKTAKTKYFHHSDEFLRFVIEALIVTLYMHHTKCQTINAFKDWLGKSNWPTLIKAIESQYLGVWKIHIICDEASVTSKQFAATALVKKKEKWINNGKQPPQPNWTAIEKQLLLEFN